MRPWPTRSGRWSCWAWSARTPPKFEQAHAYLKTSLHPLEQVLADINTILAIRDKHGLAEPEPVPLAGIVEQVRQSLQGVLHNCGGALRTTIPAGLRGRGNRAYR